MLGFPSMYNTLEIYNWTSVSPDCYETIICRRSHGRPVLAYPPGLSDAWRVGESPKGRTIALSKI
jgi:hypothetical protein